ncbi:2-methylfumaryl-CoA isomerase [Amycolatopsis rubida]|uniref:2-methylfumaryl-CoA isomerase n=1 Tax=Amycolatopsis rubida TaxID=112413 RepID=A0ABX0C7Z8_9PSEU|nr:MULTISPECIES: CoA transferase [Amycolatopsis]MYW97878.1 2-methylfumaryl-CoA isomerase [Amycolatopsis rubida]NEC62864.1 2-methylfumaryl-CoA isomerase [Amycolatopsis rubida]OAP23991.1 E-cinnamoyl-CoA:R-phenyllactate CoA transferase [Amycolatopsis sp. M39]
MNPALLAGLRVVELSAYVATPLCGLTLAQLGADVVRVEPLGGAPDRTRWPLSDTGTSLYWSGLNKGKRAVAVDLESEVDRRRVAELIVEGGPCVVVTNTSRHADLGYEALSARRPDLIHVLLDGRADGGAAVDYTVQAATGFPLLTGTGTVPVNHVVPAWDVCAGLYLAIGLLAAERHRQVTGRGRSIRVALEDVALATAGNLGYLAEAQLTDHSRTKSGNEIYGTYGDDFETADGVRVMIVLLTERHWHKMLAATGLSAAFAGLSETLGISFATESDRYRHRDVITPLLARWFGRTPYAEVAEVLTRHRILWERYRSFAELGRDGGAALRELALFESVDQPGAGAHWAPKSPIQVDGGRLAPRPAPGVGQHNDEVLGASADR